MTRTTTLSITLLALAGSAFMTGCRVERTRGQRHQARAIQTVLETETQRLSTLDPNADPNGVVSEYRHLLGMYQTLNDTVIRSAWASPQGVQQAEDSLIIMADDIRSTPTYQAFSPDTKVNFERQVWRNRLSPWQQWRGPGWQTKRAIWEEQQLGKPAGG